MERVDLNLVVSLCSGLGSFQVLDDGRRVYVKDEDCLCEWHTESRAADHSPQAWQRP